MRTIAIHRLLKLLYDGNKRQPNHHGDMVLPWRALAWVRGKAVKIVGGGRRSLETTGAGDCFVGGVAAQRHSRTPIEQASEYANVAGIHCVQRMGADLDANEAEVAESGQIDCAISSVCVLLRMAAICLRVPLSSVSCWSRSAQSMATTPCFREELCTARGAI